MKLEMARQLALALLEAGASSSKVEYAEALELLEADFTARPIQPEHATQSQESVTDQLRALVPIANNAGLYDAADHITHLLSARAKRAERRQRDAEWSPEPVPRRADGTCLIHGTGWHCGCQPRSV